MRLQDTVEGAVYPSGAAVTRTAGEWRTNYPPVTHRREVVRTSQGPETWYWDLATRSLVAEVYAVIPPGRV